MTIYRVKKRFKKKKKSIFKKRGFWYCLSIFVLLDLLGYFLFFSPVFKIKTIELTGTGSGNDSHMTVIRQSLEGKNFFLVSSKIIEKELLSRFSEIKEIEIQKKFPRKIILSLLIRTAVGIWCPLEQNSESTPEQVSENNCFLVDEEGIIFQTFRDSAAGDLFVIFSENKSENEVKFEEKHLGEKVISQEKMNQLLKIAQELKKLKIETKNFILREAERLDLKTQEGWEIYFDLSENLELALLKLKLLLEKEISPEQRRWLNYINLRFNRVYYQ